VEALPPHRSGSEESTINEPNVLRTSHGRKPQRTQARRSFEGPPKADDSMRCDDREPAQPHTAYRIHTVDHIADSLGEGSR
jgi:hypothetical protein